MSWTGRFQRLVPDLSSTLLRFPVPAAISVLLCLWLNIDGAGDDEAMRIIAATSAAFMLSGAAHLFAESRKLGAARSVILALAAGGGVFALAFFNSVFATNSLFLFAGLLPVLMIAPFLRRDVAQGAIWLFNLRFGLAALLAFVVALVFGLGLSALSEALRVLFGLGTSDVLEHIWYTAMSLVAPLYGLSLMPRHLNEEVDVAAQKGSLLDRGISVLVNYVAVPVIIAYALILHAYALKILFEGELPEGQIGTMVSVFAIGGTAAWLVAWPWREQGTKLLRLFMRFWFFLLVVPAVLLTVAIWRRLSDYGVTPDRYGIVLVAIWIAALAAYLAIRRNRADMRAILGGAALLLLVGAFGPWGANGLTISSQFERLRVLLEQNSVLLNGKLAEKPSLPATAANEGNSMLVALQDAEGLDRLKPWVSGIEESVWSNQNWTLVHQIGEKLGLQPPSNEATYFSFSANAAGSVALPSRGRLFGPFDGRQYTGDENNVPSMSVVFSKDKLIIRLTETTRTIPQADVIDKVRAVQGTTAMKQQPLTLDLAEGGTLVIDQAVGNSANTPALSGGRFWVILPPEP